MLQSLGQKSIEITSRIICILSELTKGDITLLFSVHRVLQVCRPVRMVMGFVVPVIIIWPCGGQQSLHLGVTGDCLTGNGMQASPRACDVGLNVELA